MKGKKASIFIYVLLLVNISLIIGYIIFNNTYILNNNINIGKNSEEVFLTLSDKANINIETVKKYNSNGGGFLDGISCPTNVTMSGTTIKQTGMSTSMVNQLGNLYCSGNFNGDDFRIYFDSNINDFNRAYYKGEFVDLEKNINTNISIGTTNILLPASTTSSTHWLNYTSDKANDGSTSTWFDSKYKGGTQWITFNLGSERSIGKLVIKKEKGGWKYWGNGILELKDNGGSIVETISINGMKNKTYKEIDLKYRGLTSDVRSITLKTDNRYLNISELEGYELLSSGSEELWEGVSDFSDSDSTLISFTSDGITGADQIDDDLNSDNYKVTSIGDVYYQNGYQDDDVVPRLTIFGNVKPYSDYFNVFWNNYKTNKVIDENTNNNDSLNVKISDVTSGYMFFDIFNTGINLYDIKIMEYDKTKYTEEFSLLPINIYNGENLSDHVGYLQVSGNDIALSKDKTGNEFIFNFKDKDYGIFIKNKESGNLAYRISAETSTGSMIYINPIDDSKDGIIESLSNHIIIGGEKNFIGENFKVVGAK